jgi:signal transduction histidine kinase
VKLKRFEASLVLLYITSSLAAAFIASGIYLLCLNLLDLGSFVSLFISSLIWLYMLMLLGLRLVRAATRPTSSLYAALEHLSEGQAGAAPPDPEAYGISKSIVEQVVKDVYQLSAGNHQAQSELSGAKEFLDAVVSLQTSAIITIDRNRQISYANKHAINLAPKSTEQVTGLTLEELYELEFASGVSFEEWFTKAQQEKIQDRRIWERVRINKTDDSVRYFDMVADYNKNESHGVEAVVVLFDKTENYHADDEQLGFVSLAVHELRSPITLLRGYIEVFEDELAAAFDDDQRLFMQKMSVSAAQLSTFVNNILNVSRIENDQLKVHIHEDTIYEAIQNSQEDFSLRADVHGRKLAFKLDDGITSIGLDRVAIYEVLSNLIDNAIKYSKEGGEIIVAAKISDQGGVSVSVQDFGVGIPASSMENLFERFYRSHHSKDKVSGTGLGLFLSKRIVEAHGGTIWVESKEGEGSTFGFDLPSFEAIKNQHIDENPNDNEKIVRSAHGWIKNHGKVRK